MVVSSFSKVRVGFLGAVTLFLSSCALSSPPGICPTGDPNISVIHFHAYYDVLLSNMSIDGRHPAEYDTCLSVAPGRHAFSFTYEFETDPDPKTGSTKELVGKCSGSIRTHGGEEYTIDTEFDGPKALVKAYIDPNKSMITGGGKCASKFEQAAAGTS